MRKHVPGILTALLAATTVYAQNDPNLYDTWRMSSMNTTYSFWDRSGDDVDMGDMSFDLSTSGSLGSCKVRVSIPFDWRTEGKTVKIYFNMNGKSLIVDATAGGGIPLDTVKKYCKENAEVAYRQYADGFKVNPVFSYAISGNNLNLGGGVLTSTSGKQRVPWPPQQETKTTTLGAEISKLNNALTTSEEKKTEAVAPAKKNGYATFVWNTGAKYEGEWKDDYLHGKGTLTHPDGESYTGQWQMGIKHGKGTYTYANGDVYTGEYKYDMRDGYGVLTSPDGSKYEGQWKGNQDGQGTYTWPDGSTYTGEWKAGTMHGQGTYISETGEKMTGEFSEGNFVK